MPITPQAVEKDLAIPNEQILRAKAAELHHPILRPVEITGRDGLTPDQAAVLAVLLNPSLRAIRNQRQAAAAQAISAGILPNPQFSFSEDFPAGGADANTLNAYGLGLNWDVTSLLTREAKINAAKATVASVDLDVAWQEWQIAQAAKTAVYDLIALQAQLELAKQVDRGLAENASLMNGALERHDKTVVDLSAAQAASLDAHVTVLTAERDVRHQRLILEKAIGLPPDADVKIRFDLPLPSKLQLPDSDELMKGLEDRRLDLVALRQGYQSQEQTLRAAVLAQFPKVNIGFNKARDTSNVKSYGFGVTIDVPIFDRNQGVIAAESATRQKLFDEYVQRIFEARSDAATALDDVKAIEEQLAALQAAVPSLQKLVDNYKINMDRGNVDVVSYYTALGNLVAKQIGVLKLQQQLMDNRIAVEIATGRYIQ